MRCKWEWETSFCSSRSSQYLNYWKQSAPLPLISSLNHTDISSLITLTEKPVFCRYLIGLCLDISYELNVGTKIQFSLVLQSKPKEDKRTERKLGPHTSLSPTCSSSSCLPVCLPFTCVSTFLARKLTHIGHSMVITKWNSFARNFFYLTAFSRRYCLNSLF